MEVELEEVARAANLAAHSAQPPFFLCLDLWVEGPELLAVPVSSFDDWVGFVEWVVFLTNFWTKPKNLPNFDRHWIASPAFLHCIGFLLSIVRCSIVPCVSTSVAKSSLLAVRFATAGTLPRPIPICVHC
jgi:hypothetical protein